MSNEAEQLELAVTQNESSQDDAQDAARSSETPANTEGETQSSATDTEEQEVKGAETDEQKNKRVQQEEQERAAKRSRGVQKRMDELTRDKYAERQAREALERQNAELLAILKGGQRAGAEQSQDDGRPNQANYTDFQEFVRDEAAWIAEQRAKAFLEQHLKTQNEMQRKQAAEMQERQITQAYIQRHREIAKTIPDFEQTMADGAQDISVPSEVFNMMRRLPNGPLLAYHMVKNPALAEQFWTAPPEDHGYLLGQISATLKAPAKVSNAPPPGRPAQAKTGSQSEPPEDTEAYMAWAAKHMR